MANGIDIISDTTGLRIADLLGEQNAILRVANASSIAAVASDLRTIQQIVKNGYASQLFNVGDQIIVPWRDTVAGTDYTLPFDIVHFGNVELQDGETVPGMFLQSHYAAPFGVQFSHQQAFYKVGEEPLAAGTYYLTFATSWGNNVVANDNVCFTLTQDAPAGSLLVGFYGAPDLVYTNWKVYVYASDRKTILETVDSVTKEARGKYLGLWDAFGNNKYGLNGFQRTAYGNNRWSVSALRQFLNSAKGANEWWEPQTDFDIVPDQINKAGWLTGFGEDFLSVLGKVKVKTALNTVVNAEKDLGFDETFDKFFVPSLEERHYTPQIAGEGEIWDYWKRASESATPLRTGVAYSNMITYGVENHVAAQTVRFRSAGRGTANDVWNASTFGGAYYYYYASNAFRFAPACVIC